MTIEQKGLMKELSWLELEELEISFVEGSGWTATPETISRRIFVDMNIMLPADQIRIRDDSLVKEGDVEPIGTIKIDILLEGGLMPMEKSVNIMAK